LPAAPDTVYRAIKRLYNIGVYPEWWKLEQLSEQQWGAIDALVQERDPYCRGVVLLGLHASVEALAEGFKASRAGKTCRGFMVGRTIFHEPGRRWLAGETTDLQLIAEIRANFEALIKLWQATRQGTASGGTAFAGKTAEQVAA
jgi:5-dehydro-2-deoxygluconokinase